MSLTAALVSYAIPAALITMLPGPDTAMVLATVVKSGRPAAVRAAWGVGTGLLIWGAAAAVGLAAALRSSAAFYDVFRLVCAAYLIFMGVQSFRASRRRPAATSSEMSVRQSRKVSWLPSFGWGYRRALLTCALNPKLGVFFVVFLPQFIPVGAPVGVTSFALAGLQAVEAVAWYLLLGRVAGSAGRLSSRRRVQVWMDRVTATAFVGFGLRLASDVRP
jgi:threonine/homoserine/homoserine lactone efflux protein